MVEIVADFIQVEKLAEAPACDAYSVRTKLEVSLISNRIRSISVASALLERAKPLLAKSEAMVLAFLKNHR